MRPQGRFGVTWLQSDSNAITAEIKTYGYKLLHDRRKDREKERGGGVGILVRSSMVAKQLPVQHFIAFEHTIVKVPLVGKKILYLISVYRLQYVPISAFMEDFCELLDLYTISNEDYVIAGDLNIHTETESADAKHFNELLDLYNLKQHVDLPTHIKGHTLDVVITPNKQQFLSDINITEIDLSHHFLINFSIMAAPNIRQQKIVTYRSVKDIDPVKLNQDIKDHLNALPPSNDLAVKVENYNSVLTGLMENHSTMKTRRIKIVPEAPWFDADYANLRKLRRSAEKRYRRSGVECEKKSYIALRKQSVRSSIDKKKTYVSEKIKQGNSCKSLYRVVNQLIDNKKEVILPKSVSEKELATRFQAFFKQKIEKIRASFSPTGKVSSKPSNPGIVKLLKFEPTNAEEINEIIKSHGIKCSPEDPVPPELLASNKDTFIPYWVDIVNLSLETGSMESLKGGVVIPLIKDLSSLVDTDNYKNYRPVTNLVFIGKLIERVVQIRLEQHMVTNDLHTVKNYAYRKEHSTELLLLKVVNDLYESFDQGMPSVVILLDLSAAFDTVDHDKLLDILQKQIGIGGTAIKWFESFLKGRTQKVKIGDTFSETDELLYGVAQGSVLGPILFKIYIRSLYDYVEPAKFRIEGFADDHQMIKQFIITLQRKALGADIVNCMNHIAVWMNEYFLRLNATKTKFLIIAPPSIQKEIVIRGVFLANECIRFVESAKNLGIILDSVLSFSDQVNNVVKSCFAIIRKLSQIKGFLTEEHLQQLVSSDIFSTLDYCNALYFGMSSKLMRKLQHVQNCAARLVMKRRIPRGSLDSVIMNLHWLKVKYRNLYKILLIVHNCLLQKAPQEIMAMIQLGDSNRTLHLREKRSLTKYGDRAFSHIGPKLWNLLPLHVRQKTETDDFKKALKSFLMLRGEEYYSWISTR